MPVVFKLVGRNALEIKRNITGIIKLSSIISIFEYYGISIESFDHIQFIIDSEIIKDDTKKFNVSNNYNLIIFVNTLHKEIKNKLTDIFLTNNKNIDEDKNENKDDNNNDENKDNSDNNENKDDNNNDENKDNSDNDDENEDDNENEDDDDDDIDIELNKPIIDIIQEENTPELSQEIIDSINIKTVELFKNEDFKRLIEIYYSNPEILKTFLNFVSHGDIIKMHVPILSEEKDYFDEIKMLKTLGINESDDFIKSVLNRFNGHLNLSLRELLTHECKKSKV
jgi:hypothetical protein